MENPTVFLQKVMTLKIQEPWNRELPFEFLSVSVLAAESITNWIENDKI